MLFCGKSGCGKTSLIRMVNGLIPHYYQASLEGSVEINGEKQRVAIASSISSQRKILIYDEPTSGLDYIHRNQFALQLKKLSGKGLTLLVIAHDPELIENCCDYVICFQKSGILWQGNLDKESSEIMSEFFKL